MEWSSLHYYPDVYLLVDQAGEDNLQASIL